MLKIRMAELVEQYLGMPFGIALNIIYTIVILLFLMILNPIITTWVSRYFDGDDKKAIISNIVSVVIRLLGWATLLRIWLLGKSSLAGYLGIQAAAMNRLADSIVLGLVYFATRKVLNWLSHLRSEDRAKQYAFAKTSNIILGSIIFLGLFKVWIVGETNISTYLGLVSAGIAIALQDIIVSIVGWVFIITVRPFWIGQRIQFDDTIGDVVDIRLFQVIIQEVGGWVGAEQSTGRLISVPNSFVFKKEIANYHAGFDIIFAEIPVVVTFESDWKKAKTILQEISKKYAMKVGKNERRQLKEAAAEYQIHIPTFDSITCTSVEDHGVNITMRFPCAPRKRRTTETQMWEAILDAFATEETIDFAYPTQRFYNNRSEGKIGAGGLPQTT
jgi:small-conductance mechanosensitive channel